MSETTRESEGSDGFALNLEVEMLRRTERMALHRR